jgi:hypothetical protein
VTADDGFRKLWAGQSTSVVGDQVMVVALPFLAASTAASAPAGC